MFFFSFLRFRSHEKTQPIQICWLAATSKEFCGQGKNKVARSEVDLVDLKALCQEICNGLVGRDGMRFSLYLSSQLMYGTLRIFKQQAVSLEDDCKLLITCIYAPASNKKLGKEKKVTKKSTNKNDGFDSLPSVLTKDIPEIDVQELFDKQLLSEEDPHLLKEIDPINYNAYELDFEDGLHFHDFDTFMDDIEQRPNIRINVSEEGIVEKGKSPPTTPKNRGITGIPTIEQEILTSESAHTPETFVKRSNRNKASQGKDQEVARNPQYLVPADVNMAISPIFNQNVHRSSWNEESIEEAVLPMSNAVENIGIESRNELQIDQVNLPMVSPMKEQDEQADHVQPANILMEVDELLNDATDTVTKVTKLEEKVNYETIKKNKKVNKRKKRFRCFADVEKTTDDLEHQQLTGIYTVPLTMVGTCIPNAAKLVKELLHLPSTMKKVDLMIKTGNQMAKVLTELFTRHTIHPCEPRVIVSEKRSQEQDLDERSPTSKKPVKRARKDEIFISRADVAEPMGNNLINELPNSPGLSSQDQENQKSKPAKLANEACEIEPMENDSIYESPNYTPPPFSPAQDKENQKNKLAKRAKKREIVTTRVEYVDRPMRNDSISPQCQENHDPPAPELIHFNDHFDNEFDNVSPVNMEEPEVIRSESSTLAPSSLEDSLKKRRETEEPLPPRELKRPKPAKEVSRLPSFSVGDDEVFESKLDIFKRIKMYWRESIDNEDEIIIVTFEVLVKPEEYNPAQAINNLLHCIDLNGEGKVNLRQEIPYGEVKIIKPDS